MTDDTEIEFFWLELKNVTFGKRENTASQYQNFILFVKHAGGSNDLGLALDQDGLTTWMEP